jgi:hypothetical protein
MAGIVEVDRRQDQRGFVNIARITKNPALRVESGANWRRIFLLVATGVPLAVALWELPLIYGLINTSDFEWYREAAQHWLETGQWYLPEQLTGPYVFEANVHVMYPPSALYLFVPFVFLPQVIWWAVPLGIMAYALWRWRPAMWSWPLLALGVMWHRTLVDTIQGNTDLWAAGGIAAAFLWGWPAVLMTLKPTFGLFALIGIRRRSWWLAAAVFAVLNVPLIPLWFDYLAVVRNADIDPLYGLSSTPILFIPVVAWLARRG